MEKPKPERIIKYVKNALDCYDLNKNTITGIEKYLIYESNLYSILKYKLFPDNFSYNQKQSVLKNVFNKISQDPSISFENLTYEIFEINLNDEITKIKRQRLKKYIVVFPSYLKEKSIKKRHITIFGTKFHVRDYNYLRKNFDLEKIKSIDKTKATRKSLYPFRTFFIIETYAKNTEEAGIKAFHLHENFRSLLNFIQDYSKYYLLIRAFEPKSFLLPPKVFYIFDENREFKQTNATDLDFTNEFKLVEISSEDSEKLVNSIITLNNKFESLEDEKFRDLLVSALNLHNSILDYYSQKWISCLHLWQIIELITLYNTDRKISYDDVCKRFISLIKIDGLTLDMIEVFKNKRNKFVHDAMHEEITDSDIQLIKGMAQYALLRLLNESSKFKDMNGLKDYYHSVDYIFKGISLYDDSFFQLAKRKKEMMDILWKKIDLT